jgi:starch synthase (maltosyl-transferring)
VAPTGRPPIIYNLFPTLAGRPERWLAHARRARAMGFDWLYLNPVHYPGFSGSLYAVKDYGRLHPELVPANGDDRFEALAPTVRALREAGLRVMMDLVVNHPARDSALVAEHPGWYRRDAAGAVVSPHAIDPDDPERVTVWGDLAEIDNETAEDREGLWAFWESLVRRCLDLGVEGFRCDAAYKVPAALWRRLVRAARAVAPDVLFVAETLGCRLEQVQALEDAGFDYFYNSSKWWDFEAPWCLEQHERFRRVAPSIAFPESHDTERLAAETGGSEPVQRQRYAFAALFSAGLQLTIGYEFGFRRRLDVVATRPGDWEPPAFDLSRFVARVNELKRRHPLLHGEGVLRPAHGAAGVTVLRRWDDDAGRQRGLILVNRDGAAPRETVVDVGEAGEGARLFRLWDETPLASAERAPALVRLAPAEVALVAAPLG